MGHQNTLLVCPEESMGFALEGVGRAAEQRTPSRMTLRLCGTTMAPRAAKVGYIVERRNNRMALPHGGRSSRLAGIWRRMKGTMHTHGF